MFIDDITDCKETIFMEYSNNHELKFQKTTNKNNETENEISLPVCCELLIKDRFTEAGGILKNGDSYLEIRGKWNSRLEFLLSCVGFVVGIGNIWRFPAKVYESGGGIFLVLYTIFCFTFGAPLLLMEIGLGQFSTLSPTRTFKIVPIMYGLGWSMVLLSSYIVIYYAAVISWGYFYIFGSLRRTMPWTTCKHIFNSYNCLGSLEDKAEKNISEFVSSASEYWDYYVTEFIKYPSRKPRTMNESPGSPIWHLTLCLVIVWTICSMSIMHGIKTSGKIIYFTVIYPYFALFALFFLGCTLPGAMQGISFYLTPDWNKLLSPKVLLSAMEQVFYSCGIASGGLITFGSYNEFRDNFYRDSLCIILIDYFTSVLAGFAIFPIIGYMSQRNGVKIENLINSGSSLFFITINEALATVPASQFWTIMFMLVIVTLGLDSQFGLLENITTSIMDVFPILQETKTFKSMMIWFMSFTFFFIGLIFVTPSGKFWIDILDFRVISIGLLLLAFFETVMIGMIYGYKRLRYDFKVMTGYLLSWYWFIMIAYICPLGLFCLISSSIYNFERIKTNGVNIPNWGEIVALVLLLVLLLPIILGALHTIYKYNKKYPTITGTEFIKILFRAPIYWGPYYKKDWIKSKFYLNKFMKNKDDPRFCMYVSPYENINEIISMKISDEN